MKVLLVNGSPRKDGCTNRALMEMKMQFEKEEIEAEIFWIGLKTQGCIACRKCFESGECVFNDSVNEFARLAETADGFIFASPVYYGGPSGGIESFMDRLFYSSSRYFQYKPVSSVVSCRRGGASQAFSTLNMHYMISNMIVVSSQYWNQVHGNTPLEVEQDLEGLQTLRTLATNMSWIIKSIEAGKKAGIDKPTKEKRISTNFIR